MSSLTFIILCLEGAVLSFNVAASAALVPSISAAFGVSPFFAGKITWLYMLPYGIAALIYGPLVKIFDAKKVELVCLLLFSLANLLAGLSENIYTLFAARFMMGFFGASVIPLALILIARHIKAQDRGKFVGVFFSATFIASLLGLVLSGVINWRFIYIIPAVCGFVLLCFMYFAFPSFKEDRRAASKIKYIAAFRNKAVLHIFTYIFAVSLVYHGVQQWLGVYFAKEYNLAQFLISMLIMLTSLSGVFGEILGGFFADKLGRLKTVNIGIFLMILAVFVLLLKLPLFIVSLLMAAWGLGWTVNHAGLSTMLTDLPQEFINESASLNSSVRFISGGLGTALAGLLMQRSFILGFSVFGASLILLFVFSRPFLNLFERLAFINRKE